MAGETIERVVVNLSGGYAASRIVKAEIAVGRPRDQRRRHAPGAGARLCDARAPDRQVIHSIPVGFSIDDSRGIRDPRGMLGDRLGVNMHIVTAAIASVRNHTAAIGRSHLEAEALVVSPYAAGLACLVEDEMRARRAPSIDMGGGTTTIGVFFDGNLIFADCVPVGGGHVTNDIARGLSTPLAHAERMKTLFGSAISSTLDEREMIAVPQIGEEEDGHVNHVPKSLLVSIIAPRLEETFELVRNRLDASGCDKIAGRRVVLTGGACQLHGARELAGADSRQAGPDRPAAADQGPGGGDPRPGFFDRRRAACTSRCPNAPNCRAQRVSRAAGFSAASGNGCARISEFAWISAVFGYLVIGKAVISGDAGQGSASGTGGTRAATRVDPRRSERGGSRRPLQWVWPA